MGTHGAVGSMTDGGTGGMTDGGAGVLADGAIVVGWLDNGENGPDEKCVDGICL